MVKEFPKSCFISGCWPCAMHAVFFWAATGPMLEAHKVCLTITRPGRVPGSFDLLIATVHIM